jgi:glycyl-tRNA synthetase beta chain
VLVRGDRQAAGRATREVLAEAVGGDRRDFPGPSRCAGARLDRQHDLVAALGAAAARASSPCSARRSCRSRSTASRGAATVGHRFHHPGPITIGGASDYVEKLRACHVIVDQESASAIIREGAEKAAAEKPG